MDDAIYDYERREMVEFLPASARDVLDVGCGAGGFGRSLKAKRPDISLTGLEPHEAAAQLARAAYDHVIVSPFPTPALSADGPQFDVIFFNDVLEHMMDPKRALLAAQDLIRPGGLVVASIPNIRHFSVIWDLIRNDNWAYTDRGILDRTHVRFFTERTMRDLFRDTGWRVISTNGITRCRWPEAQIDTWKTRWLSKMTRGRSDGFFFMQYVVQATPDKP